MASEDVSHPTRQHQRCLDKEQEVFQLEKVRHITGNGTLAGLAEDLGNPRGCGLYEIAFLKKEQ